MIGSLWRALVRAVRSRRVRAQTAATQAEVDRTMATARYQALRDIGDRLIAGQVVALSDVMRLVALLDSLPPRSVSLDYLGAIASALGRMRADLAARVLEHGDADWN